MRFRACIEAHKEEMIRNLQALIRIPSVYQADGSGCPYGRPVQDCLEQMLALAEGIGFAAVNMDNHLGWCEYGRAMKWSPHEGANANGRLVQFLAGFPLEGRSVRQSAPLRRSWAWNTTARRWALRWRGNDGRSRLAGIF